MFACKWASSHVERSLLTTSGGRAVHDQSSEGDTSDAVAAQSAATNQQVLTRAFGER